MIAVWCLLEVEGPYCPSFVDGGGVQRRSANLHSISVGPRRSRSRKLRLFVLRTYKLGPTPFFPTILFACTLFALFLLAPQTECSGSFQARLAAPSPTFAASMVKTCSCQAWPLPQEPHQLPSRSASAQSMA